MSVLWGLAASLLIGISDTFGSSASRRSSSLQSVTAAFWAAAAAGLLVSPFLGELRGDDLLRGGLSGLAAAAALATLWRAYVVSSVGVAAPATAVVSGVIPVLIDVVGGDEPGAIGVAGIVIGLVALVLTTWSTDGRPIVPGLALGTVAGVCFAVMFILSADTSVDSGVWPMTSQRLVAGVVVTGFSLGRGLAPIARGAALRFSLLGGIAGGAGVAAVILGGQRNPLGPIAVAASLYPAVTIALHWLLFGERLRWWQVIGLGGALTGVGLIAAD